MWTRNIILCLGIFIIDGVKSQTAPEGFSFRWEWGHGQPKPCNDAVIAGIVVDTVESNSQVAYFGRVRHLGNVVPAIIGKWDEPARYYVGDTAYEYDQYQFLCGTGVAWMSWHNETLPSRALPVGRTESGETLHACRFLREDPHKRYGRGTILLIGHVDANTNHCIGSEGRSEVDDQRSMSAQAIKSSKYELLVEVPEIKSQLEQNKAVTSSDSTSQHLQWRWFYGKPAFPHDAVVGGFVTFPSYYDRPKRIQSVYLGRVHYLDKMIVPGAVSLGYKKPARYSINGTVFSSKQYQVLTGEGSAWMLWTNSTLPSVALPTGHAENGQHLYSCKIITRDEVNDVHHQLPGYVDLQSYDCVVANAPAASVLTRIATQSCRDPDVDLSPAENGGTASD